MVFFLYFIIIILKMVKLKINKNFNNYNFNIKNKIIVFLDKLLKFKIFLNVYSNNLINN